MTPAILLRFKPMTSIAAIWKKKLFSFVPWNIEGHLESFFFPGNKGNKKESTAKRWRKAIPGNTLSP